MTFAELTPPPVLCDARSTYVPFLHARLDLHVLVPAEDDPDVNVPGLGLLLAEKVVHPGLDVGAEAGDGQAGALEAVLLTLRARRLVAAVTFEPVNRKYRSR